MAKSNYLEKLRKMEPKDLVKERKKLRKKLYDLKMSNKLGSLTTTHEIKDTRRNIARVNLILSTKAKILQ